VLDRDGGPLTDLDPSLDHRAFVLSDHREFTDDDADAVAAAADARVSVGPEALHADHTVTVAHNYLDTDGFRTHTDTHPN